MVLSEYKYGPTRKYIRPDSDLGLYIFILNMEENGITAIMLILLAL